MSWFRFYSDTIHDRKIRRLSLAHRWLWVAILCLAKDSPEPGCLLLSKDVPVTTEDLADCASISLNQVTTGLKTLEDQRMVHRKGEVIVVTHWDSRQFVSDGSNERVKRHRAKKYNDDVTLHDRYSNAPRVQSTETDPESDSEKDKEPTTTTTRVNDLDRLVDAFQKGGFGQADPMFTQQALEADLEEFGFEWTIEAMRRAVKRGKRTLGYVEGVLRGWRANGGMDSGEGAKLPPRNRGPSKVDRSTAAEADERYANFYKKYPGGDGKQDVERRDSG